MKPYADRRHAGCVLGAAVLAREGAAGPESSNLLVLGLTRGGVPVAAEVARMLAAPLDVAVVRKVSVHGMPEVAMGALASVAGTIATIHNADLRKEMVGRGVSEAGLDESEARAREELERRELSFRGGRPALEVSGRCVILVDDGAATGASMRAAVAAVTMLDAGQIVVALPMCMPGALTVLQRVAEAVVCPWVPKRFIAVGQAYLRFDQVSDDEVRSLL